MTKSLKKFEIATFATLVLLVAVEIGVRLSGVVDFPTYAVDNGIGYMVKPNQSGIFLRKNAWAFNDRSMGTDSPWKPEERPNILLIGNSIVMGGNPYTQNDKLGPMIQRELGAMYSVWPIAAGGWTNVNETVYLARNPDVVHSANFFVWEYMSGGLSGLSQWRGDYVFPRQRPTLASWYVFRRYLLPKILPTNMSELPPTGPESANELLNFEAAVANLSAATGRNIPGIIFLYPTKAEYLTAERGGEWLPERAEVERIARLRGLKVVDISRAPEWNETLYREATHPTVQGNVVLSHLLSVEIKDLLKCRPSEKSGPKGSTSENRFWTCAG